MVVLIIFDVLTFELCSTYVYIYTVMTRCYRWKM